MTFQKIPGEPLEQYIRRRITHTHTDYRGTVAAMLDMELLDLDEEKGEFTLLGKTAPWMRNYHGTLHGGMGATLLDQAMGYVAFCLQTEEGIMPTVSMNVNYHRPLLTTEDVLLKVRLVAKTRSLMHMACDAYRISQPEKLCLSANATFYFKPKKGEQTQ